MGDCQHQADTGVHTKSIANIEEGGKGGKKDRCSKKVQNTTWKNIFPKASESSAYSNLIENTTYRYAWRTHKNTLEISSIHGSPEGVACGSSIPAKITNTPHTHTHRTQIAGCVLYVPRSTVPVQCPHSARTVPVQCPLGFSTLYGHCTGTV